MIVLMMFTLEEIVDLEMASDHLASNSQQSKTPYSDLTQVLKSRQLDKTKNLLIYLFRLKNIRKITSSDL